MVQIVTCRCGEKVRAQPALVGKRIPCPACFRPVTIPADTPPPSAETRETQDIEFPDEEGAWVGDSVRDRSDPSDPSDSSWATEHTVNLDYEFVVDTKAPASPAKENDLCETRLEELSDIDLSVVYGPGIECSPAPLPKPKSEAPAPWRPTADDWEEDFQIVDDGVLTHDFRWKADLDDEASRRSTVEEGKTPQTPKPSLPDDAVEPNTEPIFAQCLCGAQFRADWYLAGQRVSCPACGGVLQVPDPPVAAKSRPVVVTCGCGQRFAAAPHLWGQLVNCPACGSYLAIPATPSGISADDSGDRSGNRGTVSPAGLWDDAFPEAARQTTLPPTKTPRGPSLSSGPSAAQHVIQRYDAKDDEMPPSTHWAFTFLKIVGGLNMVTCVMAAIGTTIMLIFSEHVMLPIYIWVGIGLFIFWFMVACVYLIGANLFLTRSAAAPVMGVFLAIPLLFSFPVGTVFAIFVLRGSLSQETQRYLRAARK